VGRIFFPGNFEKIVAFNPRNSRREQLIMGKILIVTALAVFAFAFGSALRSNAGTEMVEPYRAPAPRYNYAPPPPPRPRPVFYVRPPVFGFVIAPGIGYYGRGYGFYGGRRFYGRRGFYGHRAAWHGHHQRWH